MDKKFARSERGRMYIRALAREFINSITMTNKRRNLFVDDELWEQIKAAAAARGVDASKLLRALARKYLEKQNAKSRDKP